MLPTFTTSGRTLLLAPVHTGAQDAAAQLTALKRQDSKPALSHPLSTLPSFSACFLLLNQALLLSQRLRMFGERGYIFLPVGDYNLFTGKHSFILKFAKSIPLNILKQF